MVDSKKTVLCVLGPTASGKSDWALNEALSCGGEIITADAMQVYRGMDIGTAKPSVKMQEQVPHHLLDCVNPDEDYDVARFVEDAKAIIADCHKRGVLPIICGGTNYYITALLDGIANVPKANWTLREELEKDAQEHGAEWLWGQLHLVDSVSAKRLHPHDHKRLIRAIEVFRLSGKPMSSFKPEGGIRDMFNLSLVGLQKTRDELRERIGMRTDQMLDLGLIDEVRGLMQAFPVWSVTAREAIGYKETRVFLTQDESVRDENALRDEIVLHTDQLVKKQLTWLKKMDDIEWKY